MFMECECGRGRGVRYCGWGNSSGKEIVVGIFVFYILV